MKQLSAYLDKIGHGSRSALARHCGVHPRTVSKWLRGDQTPDHRAILAIRAFTGGAVKPDDWYPAEDSAA